MGYISIWIIDCIKIDEPGKQFWLWRSQMVAAEIWQTGAFDLPPLNIYQFKVVEKKTFMWNISSTSVSIWLDVEYLSTISRFYIYIIDCCMFHTTNYGLYLTFFVRPTMTNSLGVVFVIVFDWFSGFVCLTWEECSLGL